jgi:hypothetical protein
MVDGPKAGEVQWRQASMRGSASRYTEDGTKKPMTLGERRARIDKRRTTKYIEYLKELLKSEMKEPKVFSSECVTEGSIVAAAATFGLNPFHQDRWGKFEKYLQAYDGEDGDRKEVFLGILNGIAGEWVKGLDMQLDRDGRQREYMDGIMAFLGLDPEAKWDEILKEIPDPKSWDKLNEDGTPKTKE